MKAIGVCLFKSWVYGSQVRLLTLSLGGEYPRAGWGKQHGFAYPRGGLRQTEGICLPKCLGGIEGGLLTQGPGVGNQGGLVYQRVGCREGKRICLPKVWVGRNEKVCLANG